MIMRVRASTRKARTSATAITPLRVVLLHLPIWESKGNPMHVCNCTKPTLLMCAAFLLLTASATGTARAQGDVEEAIGGLINPNVTTIYIAKRVITMDGNNSSAAAVAVSGDRIVAIHRDDAFRNIDRRDVGVDQPTNRLFHIALGPAVPVAEAVSRRNAAHMRSVGLVQLQTCIGLPFYSQIGKCSNTTRRGVIAVAEVRAFASMPAPASSSLIEAAWSN